MRFRIPLVVFLLFVLGLSAVHAQRGFRRFLIEDDDAPMPADAAEKTEFTFARLRYPSGGSWGYRGHWTIDYPKADRQFVQGVRRLTRIHTRSVEEVVDLDTDKIFDYPWIYVVEPGRWILSDEQCKKLREYLLRGGFLMTDDFHGSDEWEQFMYSMGRVFPDRPVVEIEDGDPAFHVLYDLDERLQVPGIVNYPYHRTHERDGYEARWRGIYDDKGRLMAGICFNQDLGDAWEWADDPTYPEKYASFAYRVGINYIIYAMTH
ncbi:MAG: DUF4159 domain-containing protein [Bryobacterales bacterium]|jgi:hypothetical protein|nr:DUF4159 domain-containing protein [Bryobacterales bacterium]